jgi:hypothetical protein
MWAARKPGRKRKRLAPALHSVTVDDRVGSARSPGHSRKHHGSLSEFAVQVDPTLAAEPEPLAESLANTDELEDMD